MLLFPLALLLSNWAAAVVIRHNGYEDILVGISPQVKEDPHLLESIKRLFESGSSLLYQATRRRAYFKEVTVVIPSSWTNTPVDDLTDTVFDDSDIRVNYPGHVHDNPHTLQTRGCGQPGDHIHLPTSFLLSNESNYGDPAKVLVHEWAHLRYGVFDEYGIPGDLLHPYFFRRGGHNKNDKKAPKLVFNICAARDVPGKLWDETTGLSCRTDPETDLPDENCRFSPADNNIQVSLMSYPHLESASFFCDDTGEHRHDSKAPTKHNILCSGRSTWDVIRSNEDFSGGRNEPADIADTKPHFKVIQTGSPRFVLVMDMAGKSQAEINNLRMIVARWVSYELPRNMLLSIIEFSRTAVNILPLTPIQGRQWNPLKNYIEYPRHTRKSRCIGCGLNEAMKMLENEGVIILVTDGSETQKPFIYDVKPKVISARTRVVSISITELADHQVDQLADKTNGVKIFAKELRDLPQVLSNLGVYRSLSALKNPESLLFEEQYTQFGIYTGEFVVDISTASFTFQISHSRKQVINQVALHSPYDNNYSLEDAGTDTDNGVTLIKPKRAEQGMWTFYIRLEEMTPEDYVLVSVKAEVDPKEAIKTRCWISPHLETVDPEVERVSIFAQLEQRGEPVIGAKVMAQVTQPGPVTRSLQIDLWDNGAGADITRNDGVYSRYLTNYNGPGHYKVRCRAWNDGHATISTDFLSSGVLPRNPGLLSPKQRIFNGTSFTSDVHNFTRESIAGSFKVSRVMPRRDTLPPYPVTDLTGRIVSRPIDSVTGKKRRTFQLRWTAPGDDLDKGRASHYMLKIATNFNDLSGSDFLTRVTTVTERDLLEGSLVPLVSGQVQEVTLNPKRLDLKANVVFYFAIKAMDDSGNISDLSNVMSMTIAKARDTKKKKKKQNKNRKGKKSKRL